MPDDDAIHCASYTHARRHPMVLGRIAGWAPPFQLTITQVAVVLVSFISLTWSWDLWAAQLPATFAFAIAVGIPIGAAWTVRHVRVEGRSLARTALGYTMLASAPRAGRVGGRPHRARRACRTAIGVWFTGEAAP
jgi:hypothetical protein